ncbi:MAG: hypothetical protein IPN86_17525 [Saprospiraceae bacterium]|nr:hypothetical protein [Saprospiraceae bacterium]
MEHHCFDSITESGFGPYARFETESIKLGIQVKTRHNEVSPNQFELAPLFEEANLALDHNFLLMDVMSEITARTLF